MTKNKDKIAKRIIIAFSIIVALLVVILNRRVLPTPETFPDFVYQLPKLNAFLNSIVSIMLLISIIAIKNKKVSIHKKSNLIAFILSAIFIISYVTYHYLVPETKYGSGGFLKTIYYIILVSHILLAGISLPLILLSFYYGKNNKIEKHRKITKFSWPIWFYVSITGVIIYIMISPFYSFS